jgi:hypothetical protein
LDLFSDHPVLFQLSRAESTIFFSAEPLFRAW